MSSSSLAMALACVVGRNPDVGVIDAAEQVFHLGPQIGNLGRVIGHELQVGLAAAAVL